MSHHYPSQCYPSLHCDKYGHLRKCHIYTAGKTLYKDNNSEIEFLLQLENKQMQNNVETQDKTNNILIVCVIQSSVHVCHALPAS